MAKLVSQLTIAQRVRRIPNLPGWLYAQVMRAPGDLRIANQVPAYLRKQARTDAMRQMAVAINALRRAEKAARMAQVPA